MKRIKAILGPYESTSTGYYVDSYQLYELINRLQELNSEINEIMKNQTCHLCKYSTYRKSNYTKHLTTKGHLKRVKQNLTKSHEDKQYSKVIQPDRSCLYKCKKCKYQTLKKSSINHHLQRKRPCELNCSKEVATSATSSIILDKNSSEMAHNLLPKSLFSLLDHSNTFKDNFIYSSDSFWVCLVSFLLDTTVNLR